MPVDLEELERLMKAAKDSRWDIGLHDDTFVYRPDGYPAAECYGEDAATNAALITALRNAAPAMIAELRRGRDVEGIKKAINDYIAEEMMHGYANFSPKGCAAALTRYLEGTGWEK